MERLDRACCNQRWFNLFPNATLYHLPLLRVTGHCPNLINFGNINDHPKKNIRRRFERWLTNLKVFLKLSKPSGLTLTAILLMFGMLKPKLLLHKLYVWGKNHPNNKKNNVHNL